MLHTQSFWEATLRRNDEQWILAHLIWTRVWNDNAPHDSDADADADARVTQRAELVEDVDGRGFALLAFTPPPPHFESTTTTTTTTPTTTMTPDAVAVVDVYFAFVDATHRRRGVMTALMRRVLRACPGGARLTADVSDGVPMRFWTSMGFTMTAAAAAAAGAGVSARRVHAMEYGDAIASPYSCAARRRTR
jgi:GNAT superfamily N-acetyltransferase